MKVVNETKGLVISEYVEYARSFKERERGLSHVKEPRDMVLAFDRESAIGTSIHMMGMHFPIDVLWMNDAGFVVDVKRDLKPFSISDPKTWRLYRPGKPARYVVELGKGKLGTTKVGDKIKFQ